MKKVRLLAVGSIKERYLSDALAEYTKRLARFCSFSVIEVAEVNRSGGMEKEADSILKNISGYALLLDRQGREVTSEEFSSLIDKIYLSGADTITFIIGGSDGVSDRVKKQANASVSFGKVTYPHQLMRVLAAEQIYRAFTICENMPYHK